jgi:hypothetical protein
MTKSKSRNSLDGEIIVIRRGLAIYKVRASPYWYVRLRDTRNQKNIVRSTKETSRIAARAAAEELAASILATGTISAPPKEYRFSHFANLLLKEAEYDVAQGNRAKSIIKDTRSILEHKDRGILKEFGNKDVREIKTKDFAVFVRRVIEKNSDLSASTHNQIRTCFRKVMKLAVIEGAIHSIPDVPKLNRNTPNARSFFRFYPVVPKERDDYKKLINTAAELAKTNTNVRGIPITEELRDIILFTVHSFVRPTNSELYALKHADITRLDKPDRLSLTLRKGKTGYRSVDTMKGAVSVYERIKQRYPMFQGDDDYIFLPQYKNRDTAKRIVMRQFNHLLDITGLKKDIYTGQIHSMYSLRHTCLCMRLVLSQGQVNIFALAKNAGTSVDMLSQFYLKNLPNTPEVARNIQIIAHNE